MSKINVKGYEILVIENDGQDYISLTDMIKAKDGQFYIESWLRNRNTLEFLGIWEAINNTNFNSHEFEGIKKIAGLNSFNISVKEWVKAFNMKVICCNDGR